MKTVVDLKNDLAKYLRPPGVSLEEFLAVLAQQFSSSVHDTETNLVLYPGRPPHELRVEFSKKGSLSGVFSLPAMPQGKLERIREEIQKEFIIWCSTKYLARRANFK